MANEITYRTATLEDAAVIATLSLALQEQFAFAEYSEAGRAKMRTLSSPDSLRHSMTRGDTYVLAEYGAQLVGAVGIRDNSHIVQLFVDTPWQRRGIGTELWRLARSLGRRAGGDGVFTVNASSFAIPMYEKCGFRKIGNVEDRGGVMTTPMRYDAGSDG